MADPNRARLQRAVKALDALDVPLVFLGGATVGLHLRPELVGELTRPTKDVDCIVPAASMLDWQAFEAKLRAAKFQHDPDLIVRFRFQGELYDFLPMGEETSALLGFNVRFHREAYESADVVEVAPGCRAHVASLDFLIATKITAYLNRGKADPYASKDLEDLITLLIGSSWLDALVNTVPAVRETAAAWAADFLADAQHRDLVEGHVPGGPNHGAFVKLVREALQKISTLT